MKVRRGKVIAVSAGAMGLAVLVACGFAFRDRLREEYWLWRLESGDDTEQRAAVEKLGELRSVRAIPGLLEVFGKCKGTASRALVKIGKPAVPAICERLQMNREDIIDLLVVVAHIEPPGCLSRPGLPKDDE